jgi:hypothetical protein
MSGVALAIAALLPEGFCSVMSMDYNSHFEGVRQVRIA